VRLTVGQAHELSRVAARHGALSVQPLSSERVLVQLDRRHVAVVVALGPDGRPAWTGVSAELGREEAA
jgi:hypothetical protein